MVVEVLLYEKVSPFLEFCVTGQEIFYKKLQLQR